MFRDWLRKKAAPLTGVPAVRRQKTYSAQSGYVYQYCYEGHRGDMEFVFTVSADRKNWYESSVTVAQTAMQSWEQAHGRVLSGTERYALAKMTLFAAFDERPSPAEMRQPIYVSEEKVVEIMEELGLA